MLHCKVRNPLRESDFTDSLQSAEGQLYNCPIYCSLFQDTKNTLHDWRLNGHEKENACADAFHRPVCGYAGRLWRRRYRQHQHPRRRQGDPQPQPPELPGDGDAQQQAREKPRRRALPYIVHENGYRHMDAGELERMLADTAGQRPYEDWLQAFCQRKYNSDFSREMSRSAAEYLKAFES